MNLVAKKEGKSVRELAEEEVRQEEEKKTIKLYKVKIKEIKEAKRIIGNLERELEDLELKLRLDEKDVL